MRSISVVLFVFFSLLSINYAQAHVSQACGGLLDFGKIPAGLESYELIRGLHLPPNDNIKSFAPSQGIFVTKRDARGAPSEAMIRVLSDNPNNHIEVIGDFNAWGRSGTVVLHPDGNDPRYVAGTLTNIFHGMQYRLVVNGQQLLDPAALAQSTPEINEKTRGNSDTFLNSVFWDIEGQGRYDLKNPRVDLRTKAVAVSENDIMSLAQLWNDNGQIGPRSRGETFNFIATSGIIPKLKSWGINAVEFLPLTASVDGDVWAYRYLSYAPFAIDSRWGTPAEFAHMVDAFNAAGIAVVMDIVPGHYAQAGNQGVREIAPVGKHNFKNGYGQNLYGSTHSEWGTFRYDYENPYVRKYLIDGVINMLKYYGLSGIRIDNYGGIQSLPGGDQFLRELNSAIKFYAPDVWINAETFGGDNGITRRQDWGGHGAGTHNSGDFFGFIYEMAQKRTEEINMDMIRGILRNPWGWQEQAALYYITNHDEAANSRGQASGAYFASLVNGGGWNYVEGKTRAFSALGMFSGSFYLDMPHLRIMQEGSFYTSPAVQWDNLQYESQRHTAELLGAMTRYFTSHEEFAFHNSHPDVENHTDYDNKIVSLKRIDFQTGKVVYVLINLGDRSIDNYRFGVSDWGRLKLALDSDSAAFGGSNRLSQAASAGLTIDAIGMHGKNNSVNVPHVGPFSVTILELEK